MYKAAKGAVARAADLGEWIDPLLLKQESWPSWLEAVQTGHDPQADTDVGPTTPHRMRLAYDELFAHQLTLALARMSQRKQAGRPSFGTGQLQSKVLNALPYKPTNAQSRAVSEITQDMQSDQRMNRLLQGDVGAGKTLVAFMGPRNCRRWLKERSTS